MRIQSSASIRMISYDISIGLISVTETQHAFLSRLFLCSYLLEELPTSKEEYVSSFHNLSATTGLMLTRCIVTPLCTFKKISELKYNFHSFTDTKTRMWANTQLDSCPVVPSVQRRKVWLTPTTRVPCSNAAMQDAKPVEICWSAPKSPTDLSR